MHDFITFILPLCTQIETSNGKKVVNVLKVLVPLLKNWIVQYSTVYNIDLLLHVQI